MEERLMATEMDKPKFKRKHYFIAPKFQLKYVGIILLLMFLTASLCSYVVYYTTLTSIGEKLANVYPQGRLVALINSVNFRILISMLLISPLVAVIGIFLSHKIAGPIYRMEKYLQAVSLGDFSSKLILRQGDELITLAESINSLVGSLKTTVVGQKDRLNKISEETENLKKLLESGHTGADVIKENIIRLDSEIRQLARDLEMYKM
jgi:methyl-accepting chemotaxis protein